MSVSPIDLQINFGQMGVIGKQQVLAKDQEMLKQSSAASELQKTSTKESDDVPEVKKDSADGGVVKDKQESQSKFNHKEKSDKNELDSVSDDENEEEQDLSVPGVGRKIDLIG